MEEIVQVLQNLIALSKANGGVVNLPIQNDADGLIVEVAFNHAGAKNQVKVTILPDLIDE